MLTRGAAAAQKGRRGGIVKHVAYVVVFARYTFKDAFLNYLDKMLILSFCSAATEIVFTRRLD